MENNYNTLNLNNIQNTNNLNNSQDQNQDNNSEILNVQFNNVNSPRLVYNDSVSTTTVNSVIQPNQMQQDMNDIKNDLIYTLTNNSSINTQSNNSEPVAVVNDNTVKESDNKQPIIMNTLKLKTSKLNEFLSNVAKISNNNPKQPLSQVIQLKFSDKGFEVISGDGINVLSQKDETVRFTQDISIGISNDVFINFISKVLDEYIEIEFNKEQHIIIVKADNGIYKFPERYDITTGEEVHFPINEKFYNIETQDIDINKLRKELSHAILFASTMNVKPQLCGVYYKNNFYSTDEYCFSVDEGLKELGNEVFYLPGDLVEIITSINFGSKVKLGFGKETIDGEEYNQYIKIEGDNITLYGYCKDYEDYISYPLEQVEALGSASFETKLTFNRNKLLNDVEKAAILTGDKQDILIFATQPGYLIVTSENGYVDSRLPVQNCNVNITPFRLELKKFKGILANTSDESMIFLVDEGNKNMVGLLGENKKMGLCILEN